MLPTTLRTTTIERSDASTSIQPITTSITPCKDLWCHVRLPTNVIPYHYNLDLNTFPKELKYNGNVTVYLNVTRETDAILIHARDKQIDVVKVTSCKFAVFLHSN